MFEWDIKHFAINQPTKLIGVKFDGVRRSLEHVQGVFILVHVSHIHVPRSAEDIRKIQFSIVNRTGSGTDSRLLLLIELMSMQDWNYAIILYIYALPPPPPPPPQQEKQKKHPARKGDSFFFLDLPRHPQENR